MFFYPLILLHSSSAVKALSVIILFISALFIYLSSWQDPKVGFGFALSGGKDKPNLDTGDTAVVVSDVLPNGPAMGRLL